LLAVRRSKDPASPPLTRLAAALRPIGGIFQMRRRGGEDFGDLA
jgi:hypothetical protein